MKYKLLHLFIASCMALLLMPRHAWTQFGSFFGLGSKVETMEIGELVSLLKKQNEREQTAQQSGIDSPQADFVLVDVRSDAEVAVSVIPGAITKSQYESEPSKYQGKLVVPYCTVGGRSGKYAAQLKKDGVNVKNFDGSILEWVQAGQPLVTLNGEPTKRVHIYSDRYKIPAKYEAVTE
ncbi:hypothetical protein CA13_23230 [Planctomycetes bacterium CA13]|uniref:Rhodanese domain-containing protein n=1 Tax=Novipirellula herctigrandis TaxID=2527986 RepID=A0A5C5Z1S0_9BACT|nr:hypothetical protein CA13_23230 [Planctomycetes bacterium CA13]